MRHPKAVTRLEASEQRTGFDVRRAENSGVLTSPRNQTSGLSSSPIRASICLIRHTCQWRQPLPLIEHGEHEA